MSTFAVLGGLLEKILSIGLLKEERKYLDEYIQLRTKYHEEINKPDSDRSDAILDDLESQLRVISIAVTSQIGKQDAPNQPGQGGS